MKKLIAVFSSLMFVCGFAYAEMQSRNTDPRIIALEGEHRSEKNKQRNQYRHPLETLDFFGMKPDMTVVEIWPGGGWYTEVLAPLLKEKGQLIGAHFYADAPSEYYRNSRKNFESKLAANDVYRNVEMASFFPGNNEGFVKDNSADMVLTFRNLHNWYMQNDSEGARSAFNMFFKALKPGGVLGVVDHELPQGLDQAIHKRSGYVSKSLAIKWATEAGFEFAGESAINANPKDTALHPRGVWTLPPSLRLGETDKSKYLAIGESNRMTLKFIKPM